ncbi:MAG: hypothetical protein WC783_00710 [Candidatus Paceibacterota bacterium]|jgi:hypothetical protein
MPEIIKDVEIGDIGIEKPIEITKTEVAYADIAPVLCSAGLSCAELDAKEIAKPIIEAPAKKVISKELASKILDECLEIQKNNGYLTIAKINGVSIDVIKQIHTDWLNYLTAKVNSIIVE